MKNKILFFSTNLNNHNVDGGIKVSLQKLEMLQEIYGKENVDIFYIDAPSMRTRLITFLLGLPYGFTKNVKGDIQKLLNLQYSFVFFNGSILGGYIKLFNQKGFKTFCFYHNVECLFYKDKAYASKKIFDYIYIQYIKKNEKQALNYSNYNLCISNRDKDQFKKIYKKKMDFVYHSAFEIGNRNKAYITDELYCIFVGSDFFANAEGVSWFIENVLPFISYKLYLIGTISNAMYEKYKNNEKIRYLGFVDDLAPYYNSAAFVISPIFSGSGLKTKTIEALSYGKNIIGTTETFVDIEIDIDSIGALVNTKEEFIKAIKDFNIKDKFNNTALEYFSTNFSKENVKKQFYTFLRDNKLVEGEN